MSILKYAAAVGLTLGLIFGAYTWHRQEVKSAVAASEQLLDLQYRVVSDEQRKRLVARSEASTRELQRRNQDQLRIKENELSSIKSKSDALVARLRRESRQVTCSIPSDNPAGSSKGDSTELSFDVRLHSFRGEYLVEWFAKPAARLQSELKSCIADYAMVKEELEKFK